MSSFSKEQLALLLELERRQQKKDPVGDLLKTCFPAQLRSITDMSKFKSICCSRRAGKSEDLAAELWVDAWNKPYADSLYITLSRVNAKRFFWPKLKRINETFHFGAQANEADLSLILPNKHTIWVTGAPDAASIENFRGMALSMAVIDEAQAFRWFLAELINDILVPACYDYDGRIVLAGTPNAACLGPFFDSQHDLNEFKGWSKHNWTILDNPYIKLKSGKDPEQMIQEELKRKGLTEDDPAHLRENRGIWAKGDDYVIYKYSDTLNLIDAADIPTDLIYMFGLDLGFDDQDALIVIGYNQKSNIVYIVDEFVQEKKDITAFAEVIQRYRKKYEPTRMVIDSGALGKKIAEEIRNRHSLPVIAAEKSRKQEYIELMNDAFRTGLIKVRKGLRIIDEYSLLQWKYSDDKLRRWEDESMENHRADAALYIWREARAYLSDTTKPEYLRPGSKEWGLREEQKMLEASEAEVLKSMKEDMEITDEEPNWDVYDIQ